MKCNICSSRIEIEDSIPISTARKFALEPFEYLALICFDCVEDVFNLELDKLYN